MASAAGDKPPVNDAMAASSEQSKVSPLSIRGAGVSVASARVEPCPASNFPLLRSAFPVLSAGDPFFASLILLRSAFLPRAIVPSMMNSLIGESQDVLQCSIHHIAVQYH